MSVQIDGSTGNIIATKADYSGDVSIGGTLTYEDVTNIDSVGIITARSGINVTGGRLLLGTTTARTDFFSGALSANIQVESSSYAAYSCYATNGNGAFIFGRGNGASDSTIGNLSWQADDGTDDVETARISAQIDGTPGSNDMPGRLVFFTTADGASSVTERLRITSTGQLKLGSNTLVTPNTDADNFVIDTGDADTGISILSATTGRIYFGDAASNDQGSIRYVHSDNSMRFETNSTESFRVDSSGRLLVSTSTARANFNDGTDSSHIQLEGTTQNTTTISCVRNSNNDGPSTLVLGKSRGASANSTTIVQSGDTIGNITFEGADGTHLIRAAAISAVVDGTPGANDMPGRLAFSTTADGASSPTERLRIDSAGNVLIGKTSVTTAAGTGVQLITGSAASVDIITNASTNISVNHVYNINATRSGYRYYLSIDGGIRNHSGNNVNLSDEREKKNIVDMDSTWSELNQWTLRQFHFNDQDNSEDKSYGVIAQQIEEVSPQVLSTFETNPTTTRKGVKEQKMMWMAIKALQEAMTRIETLESEVASLKG